MQEKEMKDSKNIHEFCEESCDCEEGKITVEYLEKNCVLINGEWRMKDENT